MGYPQETTLVSLAVKTLTTPGYSSKPCLRTNTQSIISLLNDCRLQWIIKRLAEIQTDIVFFNPNQQPRVCACTFPYGDVCTVSCAHTDTVSDLCATGDHDCQQVCISTPGSYKCACKDGFTLMDNGRTCSGECVCLNVFVPA